MEQIFFLVLLAVVGLLRWFSQMAEEKRNQEAEKRGAATPPPNAPVQRAPAETEEERVRRFFEALGVPTANAPLPKAEPKRQTSKPPAAPKRKVQPIDPFPGPRGGMPIPPVVAAPQAPPLPEQAPAPPPRLFPAPHSAAPTAAPPLPTLETTVFAPAAAPEFEVREVAESVDELPQRARRPDDALAPSAFRDRTLTARLATPEGLRDAIILREIFGPPRSMQPLELVRAS